MHREVLPAAGEGSDPGPGCPTLHIKQNGQKTKTGIANISPALFAGCADDADAYAHSAVMHINADT